MLNNMYFVLGLLFQVVFVYLSLGFIGYGTDHLTNIVGNPTVSKIILGLVLTVCVVLLTNGYGQISDGKNIPQLIKK